MNFASLVFFFELRKGKLPTCIWQKIPNPTIPIRFLNWSVLEHIQLIHNFFCCNSHHNIKLWNFKVGINNWKINIKCCVTCQKFWWCWWYYFHKNPLEGCFWLQWIFRPSPFIYGRNLTWCAKWVWIFFKARYLPKH